MYMFELMMVNAFLSGFLVPFSLKHFYVTLCVCFTLDHLFGAYQSKSESVSTLKCNAQPKIRVNECMWKIILRKCEQCNSETIFQFKNKSIKNDGVQYTRYIKHRFEHRTVSPYFHHLQCIRNSQFNDKRKMKINFQHFFGLERKRMSTASDVLEKSKH